MPKNLSNLFDKFSNCVYYLIDRLITTRTVPTARVKLPSDYFMSLQTQMSVYCLHRQMRFLFFKLLNQKNVRGTLTPHVLQVLCFSISGGSRSARPPLLIPTYPLAIPLLLLFLSLTLFDKRGLSLRSFSPAFTLTTKSKDVRGTLTPHVFLPNNQDLRQSNQQDASNPLYLVG